MKQRGFTLIELIIVIGIIAILSTIGTIAWRSIRDGAKRDRIKSDIARIEDAINRYRQDNGEYPYENSNHPTVSCREEGNVRECQQGQLASSLTPGYIKELPKKDNGQHYHYRVRPKNGTNEAAFALLVSLPGENDCKVGRNIPPDWWSSAEVCNF